MRIGISVLLLIIAWFSIGLSVGVAGANTEILYTCQAELPRNERCIVIAVPEKGE